MQFSRFMILSIVFLLFPPYLQADGTTIEFGPRDGSRCGHADRAAKRTILDVLGDPQIVALLADASISIPHTMEFLPAGTPECKGFRRKAMQRRSEYEFRRAQHGNPRGWAELWVYEYFELDGGIAEVALQSSTSFQGQLDYDEPLTTAWPGRSGSVRFFDADGRVVGAFDSHGRSLEVKE